MKREQPLFRGCGTALVTPFYHGQIDYTALGELIDWQIASGVNALIAAGTTGEAPTLTEDEKINVVRFTVEKAAGRVPVIAGTGSNNTAYAVRLSMAAEAAGADGILVITPYYNKTSQAGLVAHFTTIADATSLPLLIYHIPSRTGMRIAPQTFCTLSHHPRIVGVKEACGDLNQIMQLFELCGDQLDIYSGNDEQVYPLLAMGGCGVISAVSNILPDKMSQICRLYEEGKTAQAQQLQLSILPLIRVMFSEVNPIPVKEALYQMNMIHREYRLPLFPMDAKGARNVQEQLRLHARLPEFPDIPELP